jgi:hypothetical protein
VHYALLLHNAASPSGLYIRWRRLFLVSFFGRAKKENESAPQALKNINAFDVA